ncbi:MAG: hypothetical protein AMS25_04030 [Gemmatimonas sp. SM23_52]|nr:MAG: hypothetical protein AMS25_04030 [Gemmatimonas sp. SM23_52]
MIDPLLIPILGIVFAVGVPAIGLVTHFVLRPLVRDITTAIQSSKGSGNSELEYRLAQLEDAYYRLDQQVTRLLEAERFRRELEAGSGER